MSAETAAELQRIYQDRFAQTAVYRRKVWQVLIPEFFQKYIAPNATVLDLGCGYGEFINQVQCGKKFAMDLNHDAVRYLDPSVRFLEQDCSTRWPLADGELDVVFTSNFFEHLPDKDSLGRTLDEINRCIAPGGRLIAIGPNVRYLAGSYWDFWDHYLPLTEKSLGEGLSHRGFEQILSIDRFLPYTMVGQREYPIVFVKLYLRLRIVWKILGKQFLIVAGKSR